MTTVQKRTRASVASLPSGIPSVPVFVGEDALDVTKEASTFLEAFSVAIQAGNWQGFGQLFSETCFWRDALTLTFDKRTFTGKAAIVKAWQDLTAMKQPTAITLVSDGHPLGMTATFARLAPTLASLDVLFTFTTEDPKSNRVGSAKLIPEDGKWKIWILATSVLSLQERCWKQYTKLPTNKRPFQPLPRQTPSVVDSSQRGKPHAQGLPSLGADVVLDAVVIGANSAGLGNTIQLDSIGANIVALDKALVAGGRWSRGRYEGVVLHHPSSMIQLPQFPVPDGYPTYLSGTDLERYYTLAVETLKLPFFAGVEVVTNTWDEEQKVWHLQARDVKTGEETVFRAKNVVISTGYLFADGLASKPHLPGQESFKGPVQHTAEYRTAGPYKGKNVLIIGSGNSAHDVAKNLALNGAGGITILQRSPAVFIDFEPAAAIMFRRYMGSLPVDTADFLENSMPLGVMRDLAKATFAMVIASCEERNKQLEGKGYMLNRTPDVISGVYERRGRGLYGDQPKTFDLVLSDKIKIARGEAKAFVGDGVLVHDKQDGTDRVIKADGIVLATGFEGVDLQTAYTESGFLDPKSASKIVDVTQTPIIDDEGEMIGSFAFSGVEHLYFSGSAVFTNRWVGRLTAIQVMADVTGKFPERYQSVERYGQ